MNELEKRYCITYDSWQGYYVVHTKSGEVGFYKDENGLPYIDLKDLSEDAAALLVQTGSKEASKVFVQAVQQNYEGFTKGEVLEAKKARCTMGMTCLYRQCDRILKASPRVRYWKQRKLDAQWE
jgi:hypothetical protein